MAKKMKILLVDDDPLFLELLSGYLEVIGYSDVHTASHGSEALRLAKVAKRHFDCFLLDIRMPGMDGIGLCRELRKLPAYATTPIVMITSMTQKTFVDEAFQAGANDYVTKPIDQLEISARMGMVEALVSERSNARELLSRIDAVENSNPSTKFQAPIDLLEAGNTIPLSSMENYVLRLGRISLFSTAAVGIHVIGGNEIHANTSPGEFADIMAEIALSIHDVLGRDQFLLTYMGSGDFCGVFQRVARFDREEAEIMINDEIGRMLFGLRGEAFLMPAVTVGKPCLNGLLSFKDPSHFLFEAVSDACARADGAEASVHRLNRELLYG